MGGELMEPDDDDIELLQSIAGLEYLNRLLF